MENKLNQALTSIHRKIKFFIQRKIRGFDDFELHDLDSAFFDWIYPRLKRFEKITYGCYPGHLNDEKEWHDQLKTAISDLEFIFSHDEYEKDFNMHMHSFVNWFCKNVYYLWW